MYFGIFEQLPLKPHETTRIEIFYNNGRIPQESEQGNDLFI